LKKRTRGIGQFVLEDEGRAIGSRAVPLSLYRRMQAAPLVWLQDSVELRVERILKDYVVDLCAEFVQVHGAEQGEVLFAERLQQSLASIVKRLGGERYQRLAQLMDEALAEQGRSGAVAGHRGWISGLLNEYYDPMYAYQREAKGARIEFAGNHDDVVAYLRHRAG
ncbi:MAG: tRNA 2-selenouridine(34) synthase MnmH, partial [Pseudomonas sp.]